MPSTTAERTRAEARAAGSAVILYATFTALPGNAATIAALLGEYAELVRKEPGNVLFEASCRVDESDSFFVYEEYVDETAFKAHLSAPYGVPFNAAIAPLIVEPQSLLTFLRRV